MRGRGYQNAVLTVIAALLGLSIADRQLGLAGPASAEAQVSGTRDPGGLSNSLEQRKLMIDELRKLSAKMERIEAKLSSGINVSVTDMPPIKLSPEMQGGGRP